MKKILVTCCMVYSLLSCGSKKEFTKVDSVEDRKSTEQLYAKLHGETRVLEFVDVIICQVETRDSSGNVRIETETVISKKTEENKQDSTRITATRQETGKKVVRQDSGKEQFGVVNYWTWIIGFVAVIVVALVIGIYVIKRCLCHR